MIYFSRVLLFFLCLSVSVVILAEEAASFDSFKIALGKSFTVTEKENNLDERSRVTIT